MSTLALLLLFGRYKRNIRGAACLLFLISKYCRWNRNKCVQMSSPLWRMFFCVFKQTFTCNILQVLFPFLLVTMATVDQGSSDWQLAPVNLNFTLCSSTALLTPDTVTGGAQSPKPPSVQSDGTHRQTPMTPADWGNLQLSNKVTCWICHLCLWLCSYLYGFFSWIEYE